MIADTFNFLGSACAGISALIAFLHTLSDDGPPPFLAKLYALTAGVFMLLASAKGFRDLLG
jgi:hypothetical protein